ncbi:MAG TPA: ABC transporter substrate-binding protein [Nitriliruptorales bacterium]
MKHAIGWALLALFSVLITACGGSGDTPDLAATTSTPDQTQTEGPTPTDVFPVTVGSGDAAVEIPARPKRIVSLSATATEMLFAIGAGDQVVAVDEHSDFPEGVPTTDLSGFEPNVEAISSHDPDFVVASFDPGELVSSLSQVGVPTLIHPSAVTLDDTYTQIEQLGVATGHVAEAAALVAEMQSEMDAIVAEVPQRSEPLTYYHELDPNFFSVTTETFIGELYGLLGMRSIGDEAGDGSGGYPQLSPEFIVDADPDVILLADAECCGITAEEIAKRPGWDQLTAVREGRVVELDEDLASRWGPRVVEFLRAIATEVAALEPVG